MLHRKTHFIAHSQRMQYIRITLCGIRMIRTKIHKIIIYLTHYCFPKVLKKLLVHTLACYFTRLMTFKWNSFRAACLPKGAPPIGVGWVIQGWVGHAGVGWGGSYRGGGLCHGGVGCVMEEWGGSRMGRVGWGVSWRGGMGHGEVGWGVWCRGGVGCE